MKKTTFILWLAVICMLTFTACSDWLPKFHCYDGTMIINGQTIEFKYEPRLYPFQIKKPSNSVIFQEEDCFYFYLYIWSQNTGQQGPKGAFEIIMQLPDGVELMKRYHINTCAFCDEDWDPSMGDLISARIYYFPVCSEYVDTLALWQDATFLHDVESYANSNDRDFAAREMRMIADDNMVDGYVKFVRFEEVTVKDQYPAYEITFNYDFTGICKARSDDSIQIPVNMKGKVNATCVIDADSEGNNKIIWRPMSEYQFIPSYYFE